MGTRTSATGASMSRRKIGLGTSKRPILALSSSTKVGLDLRGNQPVCRVRSAMTWPRWLRRAVRNRHRHAIEQCRVDGVEVDAAIRDERAVKFDFHTGLDGSRALKAL